MDSDTRFAVHVYLGRPALRELAKSANARIYIGFYKHMANGLGEQN
jgi:hypothetical protein